MRSKLFENIKPQRIFHGFIKKIVDICKFLLYILLYYNKPLRRFTAKAERGCIIEKKCDH